MYPNVMPYETYCYKVTAYYESETDTVESDFAYNIDYPYSRHICLAVTDNHKPENKTNNTLVFPNPVSQNVNVVSDIPTDEIIIYNQTGSVIYIKSNVLKNEYSIDVSGFPVGIYYIKILNEKDVFYKKIIVIH